MSHEAGQGSAFQGCRACAVAHHDSVGGALHHDVYKFAVILNVLFELALLNAIERGLRNVHVSTLDQLRHMAEKESEQQRTNVGAVDVGVRHQDQLAVAQLAGVEILFADAAAEGCDHGANFFVAQHLVVARFFHVENFALERQNRLVTAIATLLRCSAGRLALDQVEFAAFWTAFAAVCQLTGQATAIEGAFAPGKIASLARCFACTGSFNRLINDAASDGRVLFQEHPQALIQKRLDGSADIGIQLALGLTLKLRLRQLDADDGDQAFTHVVAG